MLDALDDAGLLKAKTEEAILERLDLYALRRGLINTGYRQGMRFLKERREHAADVA